jgi:hypothetical protein
VLEPHADANVIAAIVEWDDLERLGTIGCLDECTAELELRGSRHAERDFAAGISERREDIDRLARDDVRGPRRVRRRRGRWRALAAGRDGEEGGKPHLTDGNPGVIDPTHRRHRYPPAA